MRHVSGGSPRAWRSASLVAAAAAMLALTTACGQEKGEQTPKGQNVGNEAPVKDGAGAGDGYGSDGGYGADSGSGASKAKAAGQLAVWDSKKLGKVVTDSAGFTLYRFDKDTAEPPKSNCDGACETAWPVVAAKGAKAAPGVDKSLLGEVTRSDGSKQLTIDGWPMYRFAKDTKPGDAKGQGVGGTWYAAAPDGKKAAPAADSGADSGGDAAEPADLAGLSTRNDPKLGEIVVDKNGKPVEGMPVRRMYAGTVSNSLLGSAALILNDKLRNFCIRSAARRFCSSASSCSAGSSAKLLLTVFRG
mgnify:CR=1 FL=1